MEKRIKGGHYGVHRVEINGDQSDISKLKKRINFLEIMDLIEYFTELPGEQDSDLIFILFICCLDL